MKIILCLLFLAGGSAFAADFTVENIDKSFVIDGRPRLIIKNMDGNTILRAGSGSEIQVRASKEVRYVKNEKEAQKVGSKVTIRIQQMGNTVEIAADYPKGWFSGIQFGQRPAVMIHFEVTAPSSTDIDSRSADGRTELSGFEGNISVRSADGDVFAVDLRGEVSLAAADGDIDVSRSSGQVQISVADGDVTATEVSGAIRLRSADGDIMLTRADGKVEARASDGSVLLDGVFQTVSASTSDGRLEVKARPGSVVTDTWTIRTSDGRLFLSVPEDIQADFDLKTSDGRIHTDLPIAVTGRLSQNRLSGKMNGGGPLVTVQSADGPIQISRTIE